MIKKKYDVIVVGAGPAGSVAAASLARQKHDVLLIDRQSFPRDKVCGDGIPPGTMHILDELGLGPKIDQAGFNPIERFRFQTTGGRILDIGFSAKNKKNRFFIAPRLQFDTILQSHALASGAAFLNAPVTDPLIDNGMVIGIHVKIDGQQIAIRSKLTIGADGISSVVARHLDPANHKKHIKAVAIRAYAQSLHTIPNCVEFFWLKEMLPGYAWIFPLGPDTANVGLWLPQDRFKKTGIKLKDLLIQFLEKSEIRKRLNNDWDIQKIASWPIYSAKLSNSRFSWDGALLTGDAAALVDPLSGEGIYNAVRSAQLAAEVGHQGLLTGNVSAGYLSQYDTICRSDLGPNFRRSYLIRQGLIKIPIVLDWIFALAGRYPKPFKNFGNRFSRDFQLNEFKSLRV